MKHGMLSILAALAMAFAGAAQAQQPAFTNKSVHLRAGAARDYPVVAILAPDTQVAVYGCVPGYTWCDVTAGMERGWVYAGNLVYQQPGGAIVLPNVAAAIGIAIGAFIIEDYWHDHYVDRWWWPQRQRWFRPAPPPPIRSQPPHPGPHQPYPGPRQPAPPRVDNPEPHWVPGPQDQSPQPAVPDDRRHDRRR